MSLSALSIRTHDSRRSARSDRGFVMIEMMLAVGIVGTVVLAVITSFSTSSKNASFVDNTATAEWLSTSQMELVRAAIFVLTPGTYPNVTAPTGFGVSNVTAAVAGGDSNIQIVTVTVTKDAVIVFEASTLKVNR